MADSWFRADVAQLVEHSLGKGEVTSSILVIGSRFEGFGIGCAGGFGKGTASAVPLAVEIGRGFSR